MTLRYASFSPFFAFSVILSYILLNITIDFIEIKIGEGNPLVSFHN